MKQQVIELLAPARDADTAIEAIKHGADAVYIGAPSHGARAAATNTVADIERVVDFAHRFNAKVYVTLNTLIYDDEVEAVTRLVGQLYRAGVDALITQDMGLLRMEIPPLLALHASTQCDTRDASKAAMLRDAGFTRVVVAREMSVDEIATLHREVPEVDIEAFVHGALCVSYSGDCRASLAVTGRSANRGECAQICRYRFDLLDGQGKTLVKGKHLLSLRDMNRSRHIAQMIEAGVTSFKIEGRLKDTAYVKNVTAYYRRLIDDVIAANPGRYRRASQGTSLINFTPSVHRSFNRGFTDYFTGGRPADGVKMASIDTPKSRGEYIGTITSTRGKTLRLNTRAAINNGDGLTYFDARGDFNGFRVNRVDGPGKVIAATPLTIPAGTKIYRNHDKAFADILKGETATRTIATRLTLRPLPCGDRIALDATDERGNSVTAVAETGPLQTAHSDQLATRRNALSKTGHTIYTISDIDDRCGDKFIPLSVLSQLRRDATDLLDRAQRAGYRREQRAAENPAMLTPRRLTYHDNVANESARRFYSDHGSVDIQPAAEAGTTLCSGDEVMVTRYCLRREMGRCLKTPAGKEWKEPLTLVSGSNRFTLKFDCAECRMKVLLK